jgi:hypothetical protein
MKRDEYYVKGVNKNLEERRLDWPDAQVLGIISVNKFLCVCLLLLTVVGGSAVDRYELGNSFSGSFLR